MSKVVKFGGSSLASAEQFRKVGDIVRSDAERRYVVPSAPGKRFDKDSKVTDMLYACYELAEAGKDFREALEAIRARYREIVSGLELSVDLDGEFGIIEKNFQAKAGRDYAASRGEYLNGIIMAAYLDFEFVDAAEVIRFDGNGSFNAEETNRVLAERLGVCRYAVIPGFYGAKPDGGVKTFSRGGSDITGSIVAKAVLADVYENWTDVSGFRDGSQDHRECQGNRCDYIQGAAGALLHGGGRPPRGIHLPGAPGEHPHQYPQHQLPG